MHIRHATPDDEPALRDFLAGLSEQSRYMRFFQGQARLEENAVALATCERHDGIGLVALDGPGAVVAHAHLFRSGAGLPEMGIAVADAYQRRGLGSRLLDALGQEASRRGIRSYRAVVLSRNEPMLRLLGSIGCVIAESDTEFFDLVVGTGGTMPAWPAGPPERPRVLVEGQGWYSSAESAALTSLGCDTLRCTGRLPAHTCPLLDGGSCPLVDGADLVVVAFGSGDPNRAVLGEHLSRAGSPPVVAVSRGGAGPEGSVPGPRTDPGAFADAVGRALGSAAP